MKRRTFIGLSALSASYLALTMQQGCAPKSVSKALGQPLSLSQILNIEQIREIGLAYRQQFPSENNINHLADLMISENSLGNDNDSLLIRSTLDKRTKMDFSEGKIVIVKGWVLSENEARQCALFSLLES
jgi:hypothetical protein